MNRLSMFIAEFLGTMLLVFFGTGAIVINDFTMGGLTHLGIALVFGIVVMAMIYSVGNVSGAHLNPAVTLAFWVDQKIISSKVPLYLSAQFAGAIVASMAVQFLIGDNGTLGATLPAGSVAQSFFLETLLSFILMFVILNVSTGHMEKGIMAGVAVGGTVFLCAAIAGPICGASMNPARSLGPAIVSGNLQHIWVYLAAPVLGMLIAVAVVKVIQTNPFNDEKLKGGI